MLLSCSTLLPCSLPSDNNSWTWRPKPVPAIFPTRQYVDAGGLIAYGASLDDLLRRSAGYVDKLLKGAKPADLPVEQPTRFELIVNLKRPKHSASSFRTRC